jgi:hypothetical protein
MYHIGKTVKVLSPKSSAVDSADESAQAVVMMWDDNLLTLGVDEKLREKIREGDIVVVDYSPISEKIPAPKMMIIKILHGDLAEKTWREYKEYFDKVKKRRPGPPVTPPQQVPGYR